MSHEKRFHVVLDHRQIMKSRRARVYKNSRWRSLPLVSRTVAVISSNMRMFDVFGVGEDPLSGMRKSRASIWSFCQGVLRYGYTALQQAVLAGLRHCGAGCFTRSNCGRAAQ